MVCPRCILAVSEVFSKHGYSPRLVELGRAHLDNEPPPDKLESIAKDLTALGFEILDDPKSGLVNRIKSILINEIHHKSTKPEHLNFSDFLSNETGTSYDQLSHLFSSVEGITIEKFIILQKTEKVKELLIYDQLSLSEIAFQLGYSSVAHLSSQFKKVTGLTPTEFRKINPVRSHGIDILPGKR